MTATTSSQGVHTDPATGALSGRRRFIPVQDAESVPDGLTLEAEGCLWLAVWDSGEVRRYAPDGRLDTVVRLSALQLTSAAFGCHDLGMLYITTTREGSPPLSCASSRAQPDEGDISACTPGVTVRPPFLFSA